VTSSDGIKTIPFLFLIEAGLELGPSKNFTLQPFTAISEVESIAEATDWIAATVILEPSGPSLSKKRGLISTLKQFGRYKMKESRKICIKHNTSQSTPNAKKAQQNDCTFIMDSMGRVPWYLIENRGTELSSRGKW